MDLHVDLLAKVERALSEEKKANEARRGFMKVRFLQNTTPLTRSVYINPLNPLSTLEHNPNVFPTLL